MKIRSPKLLAAAGWLASQAAFGLVRTLHFDHHCLGPDVAYGRATYPDRILLSIWHEKLLLPTVKFGGPDLAVLISKHADGRLLGSLIQRMGMGMVGGSTNRGGVEAVRQIVRDDFPYRSMAITPDGPRGPRRVVQPGVVYVASRTGMKVVAMGVGYHRPWRLKSWDRFAIPRPTSRVRIVHGEPITIPPKLRADELEPFRLMVQAEMDRVDDLAEQWAETGRLVVPQKVASRAA